MAFERLPSLPSVSAPLSSVDRAGRGVIAESPMRSSAKPRPLLLCLVRIWLCLCLCAVVALPAIARAAAPAPAPAATGSPATQAAEAQPSLTAAEARQLLTVLQNPARRAEFITTLQNLERALPALTAREQPAPPAPAQSTAPASASASSSAGTAHKTTVTLKPNSLGADLLTQADTMVQQVTVGITETGGMLLHFRDFRIWFGGLADNATMVAIIFGALWRLALVLIAGFLCDYALRRALRPVYARLGQDSGTADREAQDEIARSHEAVQQAVETAAENAEAQVEVQAEALVQPQEDGDGAKSEPLVQESPAGEESSTAAGEAERQRAREEAAAEAVADLPSLEEEAPTDTPKPFHGGWAILRRLPYILGAMIVDAVPVLGFLLVANLLLATPLVQDFFIRIMVGAVVNAYVLCRLLLVLARGTFCAPIQKLRLLQISDDAAAFLAVWSRSLAIVVVVGFGIIQLGSMAGMTHGMQKAVARVFSLVIHLMLVFMVFRRRREVASWLHGDIGDHPSFSQRLKVRFAHLWHWYAVILIMLAWFLFATEVTNHVAHPARLILSTLGYLILFRILHIVLLGALEKAFTLRDGDVDDRRALIAARAERYHRPLHHIVNVFVLVFAAFGLLQLWGVPIFDWFSASHLGSRLISSVLTIVFTLVIAIVVWEVLNFFLQTYSDELTRQGAVIRAARLRTVVPLLRNGLLIALLMVFLLTVLSEIGVNVAPLIAGASIFGVALGFGSQKLVQDFINGIFLLIENAMQVGDWVTAAGVSGSVEQLSIRTLRLRDGDGSVHIIPFSSVTTVTNFNRGMGNVTVSLSIPYEEDTDAAGQLLKDVVAQMRAEEAYQDGFLGDFGLWGVNEIDGRIATIMGRVSCRDTMRWPIQRELNRRIKLAFQEKGIPLMPSGSLLALQHPLDVRVARPPAGKAET